MKQNEDKQEWNDVNEALYEAKETFYKILEDKGYDGAYWALAIDVMFLSSDFTDVLETISWDNIQFSIDERDEEE
jgi:hypothetical protein